MKVLAVNTSGFSASIALLNNGNWKIHELDSSQKTAQFLIPSIDALLRQEKILLRELELFAVASGPGSFTGLRIGMTTVKSLAYATKTSLVGVNSLAAIAQNAYASQTWSAGKLTVAMNAYRNQLFVATFEFDAFEAQSTQADLLTQVIPDSNLALLVDNENSTLVFTGIKSEAKCLETIPEKKKITQDLNNTAVGVGEIGVRMANRTDNPNPISLLPNYFRGSAAEEKLGNSS